MKNRKELIGILISLTLLFVFLGLWLNTVYKEELSKLKAEANVIFFNSLEEANDQLFVSKSRIHSSTPDNDQLWVGSNDHSVHDTIRELVVLKNREGFKDSLIAARVMKVIAQYTDDLNTSKSISVSIDASATNSIESDLDSMIVVDFASTTKHLIQVLKENMGASEISNLKVRVLDDPIIDTALHGAFISNKGSLGNLFLGTNDYAAIFENYGRTIFKRMLPEFLMSILLLTSIISAFIFIFRNLTRERHLSQIKDDFVNNITHEFKTPISVVNVALEALGNFDIDNDKVKKEEYLKLSRLELKRLSTMVDQLLGVSKLENGQIDKSFKQLKIEEIVRDVLDQSQIAALSKSQQIDFSVDNEIPHIMGDAEKIRITISNLLDNAIKYSNQNSKISILLSKVKKNVILTIADDGPGIPKEYHSEVFNKFFRIPTADLHDVKGYGLGLYYAKKIMDLHHGRIRLSENKPRGSKFELEFQIK